MTAFASYLAFLRSKIPQAECAGFGPVSPCHASLFPHQRDICTWAIRGGRRAIFAQFGLGKTRIHLQLAWWVAEKTGGKYLIVCPLGVRQEFTQSDGPAMGIPVHFVRTSEEVQATRGRVFCTNYESVRDGKIDLSLFAGAGLDEASVLRSFGSKTYQTFLDLFKVVPYRFVFTATPSPNRYKELIHYAGFLGVMDTGEALTRFFQRNSEKANDLTLYPHMEAQFWHWMMSWACFITKPSDLGYSDEGYDLPPIKIHWHRLEVDHSAAWSQVDSFGQAQLLRDDAQGLRESAEIKRESIDMRVEHARRLIAKEAREKFTGPPANCLEDEIMDQALTMVEGQWAVGRIKAGIPASSALAACGSSMPVHWETFASPKGIKYTHEGAERIISWKHVEARAKAYTSVPPRHWIIWHDLEREREAIEKAIPEARTVYGTQDLEEREELILGFSRGEYPILATKPIIAGSGCNFQRHCADAIFLGVGYKFNDFIQAIHRIHRFQQKQQVNIHIIHLASEDTIVAELQAKWRRHDELMARMSDLLGKHRLTVSQDMELTRALFQDHERAEVKGDRFRCIHNDTVLELLTESIPTNSVDMICTSIPFGTQYEYCPSLNDMGHNEDNAAFFEQMGHLTPQLLRVLKPGRIAAIHVKDRIRFQSMTGLGAPTVEPFSDHTVKAFTDAGFAFMARITIDTDVVRENNQTYRLGWSENAKDSTKMGAGMPEYVLIFRKLQTDLSKGYADEPVTKDKAEYTLADWQLDASSLWRSSGDRLPDPDLMTSWSMEDIKRWWIAYSLRGGYRIEDHVAVAKALEAKGRLPKEFMLFPAVSRNKDIWTDISRMRTLNTSQAQKGQEKHVCPLQLDIVKRLITRYSNKGDLIFDPFGGIGTVPYQALKMGRRGLMTELNHSYWACAVGYCEAAENDVSAPTLFDMATLQPAEALAA
jgi:DNA modification methylase